MTFQDHSKNSVQSLLALLRETQDDEPSETATCSHSPAAPSQSPDSHRRRTTFEAGIGTRPSVPSPKQLNDLIATLNRSSNSSSPSSTSTFPISSASTPYHPYSASRNTYPPPPPPPLSNTNSYEPIHSYPRQSAFEGPRNQLFEPFGPVGQTPPIASTSTPTHPRPNRTPSISSSSFAGQDYRGGDGVQVEDESRGGEKRVNEIGSGEKNEDMDHVSFSRALPVITALVGNDHFLAELKKMKVDQDALERRLWAKAEKIKADHNRTIETERELARVLRRPISRDKEDQWEATLSSSLNDFHRNSVIPSIDGLSLRQRQKLRELGVPGLGDEYQQPMGKGSGNEIAGGAGSEGKWEDGKVRERVRRIMDMLDAALEDVR